MSETKLGAYRIESFRLEQIGFKYESGGTVLENVTLDLPMNTMIHVKGPTGQGQSTFLKILALLAEPTSGVLRVNGMPVTEMTFEEFLPWRLEIGYTFEMGGLLANRTLEDNLALPHLYHNLAEPDAIRAEIRSIAKRFRFEHLLDQRPASVSGGLRKLVTILRPVLLRPSFLVMDAPFAGLDLETSRELETLIFEMHEKSEIETIYFSSRGQRWPTLLGAESLWVESGNIEFASDRKAAG